MAYLLRSRNRELWAKLQENYLETIGGGVGGTGTLVGHEGTSNNNPRETVSTVISR